ncbi:MAG: sensor histidine kinase, partial [Jiangellaceae bacterium]
MTGRTLRVAAPAALALFVVIAAIGSAQPPAIAVPVAAAIIVLGAVLAWRDVSGWPLAAGLGLAGAGLTVLAHGQSANLGWFGFCVLVGWIALTSAFPETLTATAVMIGFLVLQLILQPEESGWLAWACGTAFAAWACASDRRLRTLLDQLREAQAGLAERTRAEERNRLAGEMHDVIGHALTISLLHVSSARLALDDDPELARSSLDEAEWLARASLEEVRVAVGLMRQHPSETTPLPDASAVVD